MKNDFFKTYFDFRFPIRSFHLSSLFFLPSYFLFAFVKTNPLQLAFQFFYFIFWISFFPFNLEFYNLHFSFSFHFLFLFLQVILSPLISFLSPSLRKCLFSFKFWTISLSSGMIDLRYCSIKEIIDNFKRFFSSKKKTKWLKIFNHLPNN